MAASRGCCPRGAERHEASACGYGHRPLRGARRGGVLAYRVAYGTWWGTPDHLSYCGRTYLRGTAGLTHAEIVGLRAALPGDAPYPVVAVATVPPVVGHPLLAAVTPQAERQRLGVPCTMAVYLKTGTDSYTGYALSGGA